MLVSAHNLGLSFGDDEIFSGFNFNIDRNDRTALVGINGAGKTSLFKTLTGDLQPSEGFISTARGIRTGYLAQQISKFAEGPLLERVMFHSEELKSALSEEKTLHAELANQVKEAQQKELLKKLVDVQEFLETAEVYDLEHRACKMLGGLGFRKEEFNKPLETFSGGWRMRAELATLLLSGPDLLLLDEPTNHLDLDARLWLEGYLNSFDGAVWIISHDPSFLDRTVRRVCEIEFGNLNEYGGNYSWYEKRKLEETARTEKKARMQEEHRKKIERFINRFKANPKKRNMVQSRIKMLEKMEVIETHRNIKKMRIKFPESPRSSLKVSEAINVSKEYDHMVFQDVNLVVEREDRIGIVGRNGEGKSTLSRILTGIEEPGTGTVELGHNIVIGYYSQEVDLDLDPDLNLLEQIRSVSQDCTEGELRSWLGMFLFTGDDIYKKTGILSGGEKSRLALARILISPINFLVLDEPTNHLDIFSREVLENALRKYHGTLMLISHDEKLLYSTIEKIYEVADGSVELFHGSFESYLSKKKALLSELFEKKQHRQKGKKSFQREESRKRKHLEAAERNSRYRRRRKTEEFMKKTEEKIISLEETLNEIETLLITQEIISDVSKLVELQKEHAYISDQISSFQKKWDKLADEYESL